MGDERGHAVEQSERAADGRADVVHDRDGVSAADRHEREHTVVAGEKREAERSETGEVAVADDRAGKTVAERLRAVTAGLLEKAGDWENAALNERIMNLSRQVQSLSEQLSQLPGADREREPG